MNKPKRAKNILDSIKGLGTLARGEKKNWIVKEVKKRVKLVLGCHALYPIQPENEIKLELKWASYALLVAIHLNSVGLC